jgi:hypothetical protein
MEQRGIEEIGIPELCKHFSTCANIFSDAQTFFQMRENFSEARTFFQMNIFQMRIFHGTQTFFCSTNLFVCYIYAVFILWLYAL